MIETLIRNYIQAYNEKDVAAMLSLLDDQIVFENVSNPSGIISVVSKTEFEKLALQSLDYFTERRQIIRFMISTENAASVEINYQATIAADLPNGLKAGQELVLRGVSIFEMRNQKLSRISDYS